ncbi:MAG: GH1 family beta-glucosidase [Planctomycetota bacterium]
MKFPSDFRWGVATSSYQIEGAVEKHGRGLSVWDDFCRRPGAVRGGATGDVACDHVNRYAQDIGIMKQMGVDTYRFSVSWPRVMPEGVGAVSETGLGFYDRLVDDLLAAGIEPLPTLFHWDYPLMLQHRGGWLNPSSPAWFEEYTGVMVDRLSDRVSNWMTINEPQVFINLGFGDGTHAPGLKLPVSDLVLIAHRVMQAHGLAARKIRERARTQPRVGWAPVGVVSIPETDTPDDIEAARAHAMACPPDHLWNNTWYNDPVFLGHYPQDGLQHFERYLPTHWERDLAQIHQPMDMFGVNIYRGAVVRAGAHGVPEQVPVPIGAPRTAFGWEVTPKALYWGPKQLHDRYHRPIIITENGIANRDWVMQDGKVHDPQRIDYTRLHLVELARAMQDGVHVEGYCHWSLLDNFEWAEGYEQRFGLVHVDFETQERTRKDSAYWYADVIKSGGASLSAQAPAQEGPSERDTSVRGPGFPDPAGH